MLSALVLVGWNAGPGVEVWTVAFWVQQAIAAALTFVFLRWLTSVAERRSRSRPTNVLRFTPRR